MWQQWQEDPVCCSNGHLDKHPWWSKSMCKNWKLYQNLHTNNIIVSLLILLVSRGDYFGRLVSERAKFDSQDHLCRWNEQHRLHNLHPVFTVFSPTRHKWHQCSAVDCHAADISQCTRIWKQNTSLPAVKWTGGEFISVKPALGSALKTWWKHILTQIYK